MKLFSEKGYHELFEAGIWLKAVFAVVEIVCGFALAFTTSQTLNNIVLKIFGEEIIERPQDTLWSIFFHGFQGISPHTQSLWAFLLLSHGIVKVIPIAGVLWKKMWAYPLSIAIFGGFVIYQTFQIMQSPSILLEALTVFDVIVIVLVAHEYRHLRTATG